MPVLTFFRRGRATWLIWTGFVLALVLAVWVLANVPQDEARLPPPVQDSQPGESPHGAHLHGRGVAGAVDRAHRMVAGHKVSSEEAQGLHGLVTGPQGDRGIPDALVFLLPKQTRGLQAVDHAWNVVTDAQGRFRFPAGADSAGRWIIAIRDDHRPGWVDGDAPSLAEGVHILLQDGEPVTIEIHGADVAARVATAISASVRGSTDRYPFPGPGVEPMPYRRIVLEPGQSRVTLLIGTRAPVHLLPLRNGYYFDPHETELTWPFGVAEFTEFRSCGFRIVAIDAKTGEAIDSGVRFDARTDSGEFVVGGEARNPDGILSVDDDLRPGSYKVTVSAKGYRDASLPLELSRAGEQVEATVTLEPAEEFILTVQLRDAPGGGARPFVLVRRRTEVPPEWRSPRGSSSSADGTTLRLTLRQPGVYDVLLASRTGKMAALVEGVHVFTSAVGPVVATFEEGVMVELAPLWREGWLEIRRSRVWSDALGDLPLFALTSTGTTDMGTRATIRSKRGRYGPYPAWPLQLIGTIRNDAGQDIPLRVEIRGPGR